MEYQGFIELIGSDQQAEQALCELKQKEGECLRIIETAEKEMRRYESIIEQEKIRVEKLRSKYGAALRAYFETVPRHVTKTQQSYRLPSGILKLKIQEPEYERDELKLMKRYPELVKENPKLDWSALKKRVAVTDGLPVDKETGEIIDGITIKSREPKFIVEVD